MWYTDSELADNDDVIQGIDDFDHRQWEAKQMGPDGMHVIISHEGHEPMPVGDPMAFDDAVAVIRFIRDNGLRDYRRAVLIDQLDAPHVRVELVDDIAIVKTDRSGKRGQVVITDGDVKRELGADMPVPHAEAVVGWLRGDERF